MVHTSCAGTSDSNINSKNEDDKHQFGDKEIFLKREKVKNGYRHNRIASRIKKNGRYSITR
jgi:hypothetical protein